MKIRLQAVKFHERVMLESQFSIDRLEALPETEGGRPQFILFLDTDLGCVRVSRAFDPVDHVIPAALDRLVPLERVNNMTPYVEPKVEAKK